MEKKGRIEMENEEQTCQWCHEREATEVWAGIDDVCAQCADEARDEVYQDISEMQMDLGA
jgi:hypothetical protein